MGDMSAPPSKAKRIVFMIRFIIGTGMVFVTTAGPLSGPAMSWNEAGAGLLPGTILLLVGHLLHTRALRKQGQAKKASAWWGVATMFLVSLASVMVIQGAEQRDRAKQRLSDARAQQSSFGYGGGGYGGGYNNTSLIERDVEHYETARKVGFGIAGFAVMFAIGAALSFRRSGEVES